MFSYSFLNIDIYNYLKKITKREGGLLVIKLVEASHFCCCKILIKYGVGGWGYLMMGRYVKSKKI